MTEPARVAAVVLAAGESRRFGGAKQLVRLGDRTLLEHVLDAARAAGLDPIIAVVPVWLTRPASLGAASLAWVRNAFPARGLSHSLRLGFAALPAEVDAAVILLGDQPTVDPDHLRRLVAARGDRPIVATAGGVPGTPPLLLEREQFALVEEATGDIGLRKVLQAHPDWIRSVKPHVPAPDIDTRADLDAVADARIGHMFDSGGRETDR